MGRSEGVREKCGYRNQSQRSLRGREGHLTELWPACRKITKGTFASQSPSSTDLLLGLPLDYPTRSQRAKGPFDKVQLPGTQSRAEKGGQWTQHTRKWSPYGLWLGPINTLIPTHSNHPAMWYEVYRNRKTSHNLISYQRCERAENTPLLQSSDLARAVWLPPSLEIQAVHWASSNAASAARALGNQLLLTTLQDNNFCGIRARPSKPTRSIQC